MQANYTIRPAYEAEFVQIKNLIHTVGINPMGLDWKRFLVAVNAEGKVIACGQLKPHGKDILELASIGTLPEYRNQGIASAVIVALLKTEVRPLYLMCVSHNAPLYEKFNFRAIEMDEMPKYFRRIKNVFNLAEVFRKTGEDLIIMKLG
jgi:amino-acid N-acetyltransferase